MSEEKPAPSPEPVSEPPSGPAPDASPFEKPPLDVVERGQRHPGIERRDDGR